MTKTQRRLAFHESFEALVRTLGDLLPADQRSFAQQQLLEVAQFQVAALRRGRLKLHPSHVSTLQRNQAHHQQLLVEVVAALGAGQVAIRRLAQ